jgi:hypothetical protein
MPYLEHKVAVRYWLQESRYLGVRYAILTRFQETLIFDSKTGNKLASFNYCYEHLEKFDDLWTNISKLPSGNPC